MQSKTLRLATTLGLTLGFAACGSSGSDDTKTSTDTNTDTKTTVTPAGAANGVFQVYLKPADPDSGTPAITRVVGVVYDGPKSTTPIMTDSTKEGACTLKVTDNPFCSTDCGEGTCVAKDTCEATPTRKSVGVVKVSGVKDAAGASEFELASPGNSYQLATSLPNPPAAEGDAVTLTAAGADFPAFTITGKMVAPLVVTNTSVLLESGKSFTLTWTPGTAGVATINVKLDLSHHGGTKGQLICDTTDTGSLTIPAAILKKLIDLGVTGFPSVTVTRANTTSATVGQGKVDLKIYSDVALVAEMPNLKSCNDDSQCPTGQTCQNPGLFCK